MRVVNHKSKNRTKPLGVIATPKIKNARTHIHRILDPVWKNGEIGRQELYKRVSDALGYEYHTAEIRSLSEARNVYRVVRRIVSDM